MSDALEISHLQNKRFFCVGIKGTGLCALAELLVHYKAWVQGSDVEDPFFTDTLLKKIGIQAQKFQDPLPEHLDYLIYSSAYDPESQPQILEAKKLGVPILSYPQALGLISEQSFSVAVTGIHGKTSTTAMIGTILKGTEIPLGVLVGSGVPSFGGAATFFQGQKFFVAEACEYRRNFLSFSPNIVLITSIEEDHLDYFQDLEDIENAFYQLIQRLKKGGMVVYCQDDPGALRFAEKIKNTMPHVPLISYGFSDSSNSKISGLKIENGAQTFSLSNTSVRFSIHIPGRHMVSNAAGALAVCALLWEQHNPGKSIPWEDFSTALKGFQGTLRRSQVLYSQGPTIIDDYGHHPRAIAATLKGFREFYPGRKLLISFMHHTYSRTKALFQDFLTCFHEADEVFCHEIYPSAREEKDSSVSGLSFFQHLTQHHSKVHFFPDFDQCVSHLKEILEPQDVFITMGAGDNWKIGHELIRYFEKSQGAKNE